jgi:isopentenyl-diphosphate delta-isomerase
MAVMFTNTPVEFLDLVDQDDNVIGTIDRDEAYRQDIHNFRVVNAFIRNSTGKLFIPRRQAHKRLFPLGLDVSVGGHVSSGESYLDAFKKEALEELNLDIDTLPYQILGVLTPHEHGVHAFMTVYEIKSDLTPNYNPHDFIEHFWLTPADAMRQIRGGDLAKDDLPRLLTQLYKV